MVEPLLFVAELVVVILLLFAVRRKNLAKSSDLPGLFAYTKVHASATNGLKQKKVRKGA